MSVWESFEALKNYVYSGDHLSVLKNKKNWFEKPSAPILALWWVPAGHIPTLAEAKHVLATLTAQGPSPLAFSFAKAFPAPESRATAHGALA
ncbi:hypothetical protein D9M68_712160 [compost metagenome]